MKYSVSLKKNEDFRDVYKAGRSCADKLLVLYVKENGLNVNRLGISVSKKVGNSVVRHRLKRLIKEAYRIHEEEFHIGFDMVFIARTNAKDCTYQMIESTICRLMKKHGVLKDGVK